MQVSVNRADHQRRQEEVARAAIEQLADRKLGDSEWAGVRGRLLEFTEILRGWDRISAGPRRGKVERLCQREP
jgi:hypothetical protein